MPGMILRAEFRWNSVSNRYSLKTCLTFGILPRNIQHIWLDFARYHCQARQQIGAGVRNLSLNPCLVRENHILFWPNRTNCVEPNVGLRGTTARSFQVFQEDRQNLHALERLVGVVT